ncbi:hypothetical protein VPH35_057387 [Triticum aestivum]
MAPPLRPWADLHADLFTAIVDHLRSLRDYVSVRGVCAEWRSALPSASPCVLVLDDLQPPVPTPVQCLGFPLYNTRAYALSIPMQRTFHLPMLRWHSSSVIGSSRGYLIIASGVDRRRPGVLLLNPVTGEQIELLPLPYKHYPYPRRVVLGPNPRPGCYTAVAIFYHEYATKVAYVTSGDAEWTIAKVGVNGAKLVDLIYNAERCRVYCLDEHGDVQVLHIPQCGRMQEHTVTPLLADRVGPTFAPPYQAVSSKISFMRLFFCEGALYQVWQNTGVTMRFRLPAGGVFTMSTDEILVLRYYPEQWPYWDAVKDLGGYSVFIGHNNTALVQAEAVLGCRFDLPMLGCRSSCVTGSTQGYLTVADVDAGCRRVLFLNPVSGEQIRLLPLPYC